jgi:hypothetical protein
LRTLRVGSPGCSTRRRPDQEIPHLHPISQARANTATERWVGHQCRCSGSEHDQNSPNKAWRRRQFPDRMWSCAGVQQKLLPALQEHEAAPHRVTSQTLPSTFVPSPSPLTPQPSVPSPEGRVPGWSLGLESRVEGTELQTTVPTPSLPPHPPPTPRGCRLGVAFNADELDQMHDGPQIQQELLKLTGQRTVATRHTPRLTELYHS